jgi:hypothetical protein
VWHLLLRTRNLEQGAESVSSSPLLYIILISTFLQSHKHWVHCIVRSRTHCITSLLLQVRCRRYSPQQASWLGEKFMGLPWRRRLLLLRRESREYLWAHLWRYVHVIPSLVVDVGLTYLKEEILLAPASTLARIVHSLRKMALSSVWRHRVHPIHH